MSERQRNAKETDSLFREWLDIAWSVHAAESAREAEAPPLPGLAVSTDALTSPNVSLLVTLRAITADRPTRNDTYYPLRELRGDGESTGYISFVRPYGVPVMLHHLTSPAPFVSDCRMLPVGRVVRSRLARSEEGEHYVELTARITDPWAVDAIRRGLLHTVSIGHIPQRVTCSICGSEMDESGMECSNGHRRGRPYPMPESSGDSDGARAGATRICYAVMHGIQAVEVSFVNVPSDRRAAILSVQPERVSGDAYEYVSFAHAISEGGVSRLEIHESLASVVREEHGSTVEEAFAQDEPAPSVEAPSVSESQSDTTGAEEDDENRLVSAEELWFVSDEDLPEWAQEARLTAAQRRRLPDSAFCGPNRSFPAHDKAHVLAGLRLLGRAKLSAAQKARVRACLLRRARRFGLPSGQKADNEESYLLYVLHPTELETMHVVVLDTKEALETAGSTVREVLAGEGEVEHLRTPSLSSLMVAVPYTEQAYQAVMELFPPEEHRPTAQVVSSEQGEDWQRLAEELFGLRTETLTSLLQSLYERFVEQASELEHYRAQCEELTAQRARLAEELQRAQSEIAEWKHRVLVDEAARLAIQAGYPPARNRSYEQLQELFSSRSDEALQLLIADLKEWSQVSVPSDVVAPVPNAQGTASAEAGLPPAAEEPSQSVSGASESSGADSSRFVSKIIEFLTSSQSRPEDGDETETFLISTMLGAMGKQD